MRRKSETPDPALIQRIEDCDTYHMPFDEAAREFRHHTAEALLTGGHVAFEDVFAQIEDATRKDLLLTMYEDLGPEEKLELMARLTGDTAIREFLKGLAEASAEYDTAMLKIHAEAEASYVLRPSNVPKDAELRIFMALQSRVEALPKNANMAAMRYNRSITLRALGDGTFKIVAEDYSKGLTFGSTEEYFDVNDIVRVGTAYRGPGGGKKREKVCRPEEMLAITRGDKTSFITVMPEGSKLSEKDGNKVVVTRIDIDDTQVLPVFYGAEETDES